MLFRSPNEMAAAFAGYLTEWRQFNPFTSFLFMYSGLVSYGIFGFLIGKRFGTRLLLRFFKGSKTQGLIRKSESWIDKYGLFAISISYFIPGVRLVMPYIAGTGKGITLLKFMLYAAPSACIWALVYFQAGRYFPRSFQPMVEELSLKAGMTAGFILLAIMLFFLLRSLRRKYPLTRKRIRYRK